MNSSSYGSGPKAAAANAVPVPHEADDAAREVVDASLAVHRKLGPGLLESVYEVGLDHELRKRGLSVERQVHMPVIYDGIELDANLRLDLVVNDCVVIEIKAVEKFLPVHSAQLLSYMKLGGFRLGLLINFNVPVVRDGIKRMVL